MWMTLIFLVLTSGIVCATEKTLPDLSLWRSEQAEKTMELYGGALVLNENYTVIGIVFPELNELKDIQKGIMKQQEARLCALLKQKEVHTATNSLPHQELDVLPLQKQEEDQNSRRIAKSTPPGLDPNLPLCVLFGLTRSQIGSRYMIFSD